MLGAHAKDTGQDWSGYVSYRDSAYFHGGRLVQLWKVAHEAKGKMGFEVRKFEDDWRHDSDDEDDHSDFD
jgi:hypothetical protein